MGDCFDVQLIWWLSLATGLAADSAASGVNMAASGAQATSGNGETGSEYP